MKYLIKYIILFRLVLIYTINYKFLLNANKVIDIIIYKIIYNINEKDKKE